MTLVSPMNMSPTLVWVNLVGSILESTHVKNTAVGRGLSRTWKDRQCFTMASFATLFLTSLNCLTMFPRKVFLYLSTPLKSFSMPTRYAPGVPAILRCF